MAQNLNGRQNLRCEGSVTTITVESGFKFMVVTSSKVPDMHYIMAKMNCLYKPKEIIMSYYISIDIGEKCYRMRRLAHSNKLLVRRPNGDG